MMKFKQIFEPFFISMALVAISSICLLNPGLAMQNESAEHQESFSLIVENESLNSVCNRIEKFTGYDIGIGEKWRNLPVNAVIRNCSVFEALRNILKSYSHSLMINEADKKVIVFIVSDGLRNSGGSQATGSEDTISRIDRYAMEYSRSVEENFPDQTITDDMDSYANEYVREIDAKRNKRFHSDAASIKEYALEYEKHVCKDRNEQNFEGIGIRDIDEYAKAYTDNVRSKIAGSLQSTSY